MQFFKNFLLEFRQSLSRNHIEKSFMLSGLQIGFNFLKLKIEKYFFLNLIHFWCGLQVVEIIFTMISPAKEEIYPISH